MIQKQKKLVAKSPIAAVSWASDQPDLEIRVFTVLASNKEVIALYEPKIKTEIANLWQEEKEVLELLMATEAAV